MSEYHKPQIMEEKPRKKPEVSPKEELDSLEQSENQEQEFDINSLDYENFDYEKLRDIPEKYHKEIALKLIEAGKGENVANNFESFFGLKLNEETVLEIINLNDHRIIGLIIKKLEEIPNLNYRKIAFSLIDTKNSWILLNYLEKFPGLELNNEIALRMLEKGGGLYVDRFLKNFLGRLDKKVAEKLIEIGEYNNIIENLEKFPDLELNKEIALKAFEAKQSSFVFYNFNLFTGLDKEVAEKFIERERGSIVIENLEKFPDLELNKEIALKFVKAGDFRIVLYHFNDFKGINNIDFFFKIYEIIKNSKEKGEDFEYLFKNLKIFSAFNNEDFNKIVEKLILDKELGELFYHFNIFKGLNDNVFDKILEESCEISGPWQPIISLEYSENFKNFKNLDHKKIMQKILSSAEDKKDSFLEYQLLNDLDKLSNLTEVDHKELVLWLINDLEYNKKFSKENDINGFYIKYVYDGIFKNFDKFAFFDEKSILKLFKLNPEYFKDDKNEDWKKKIFKNIKKFKLSKESFSKLIDMGYVIEVASNINNFINLDNEDIKKIIEIGGVDILIKNISLCSNLNTEIANVLIEKNPDIIFIYAKCFSNLDKNIILKLIEAGKAKDVISVFINTLNRSGDWPNEIIKDFDQKEIFLKTVEVGEAQYAIEKFWLFRGYIESEEHKEVVLKIIEKEKKIQFGEKLKDFVGIDKETAIKLIENENGYAVASYLNEFKNISDQDHRDIFLKLIEQKEFEALYDNLKNFMFTSKIKAEDGVNFRMIFDESKSFVDKIEDGVFKQGFSDNQIIKNLFVDEWAHACQKNPDLKFEEIKKVMFKAKSEKMPENLAEEDKKAFEEMSSIFGAENLAKFIKLKDRSYFHIAQENIKEMYNYSGLTADKFCNNILFQVSNDTANYDGLDSFDYFNNIGNGIDLNVKNILTEAKSFSNPELAKLVAEFESGTPFDSWKKLKKYDEICEFLKNKEVLERLENLKKEGKDKQYEFFSKLAFHPNISAQIVFNFMENPESFLDVSDNHSGESHNRKKPTNYLDFPHLDITADNLRDALVEGKMDNLQFYQEMTVNYQVPKEKISDVDLVSMIVNRMEKIKDTAFNFKELGKQVQEITKKYNFNPKEFLINSNNKLEDDLKNDLENVLFGKNGLKREYDEYVTTIHPKSSPEGHVAGNDTACCMPFGSGKNNVYMYNLGCATLTVQKKIGGNKLRTVAQSVLTPDTDIGQNVEEVKNQLLSDRQTIHKVIKKDLSEKQKIIMTADNIEVAHNFVDNNQNFDEILKFIYQDFFNEYLKKEKGKQNLDDEKVVIGTGYTDALTNLPTEKNTFVPIIPPGYSDNTYSECYVLNLKEKNNYVGIKKELIKFNPKENNQSKMNIALEKGVRMLTAQDTMKVSYLEGKIYADNESLIQYIHRIGNELIAKDINNELKDRPNLSIAVENSKGTMEGYIIAYEGVGEKKQHNRSNGGYYDEDDIWIEDEYTENNDENLEETTDGENNRCIYVSDLAAKPESKIAGGKLLKSFATLIEENYLKKDNPIPILAEARDQTSYPIIAKQINKLGNKYGYTYEMEEMGDYENGADTMHRVVLRPKKIKK